MITRKASRASGLVLVVGFICTLSVFSVQAQQTQQERPNLNMAAPLTPENLSPLVGGPTLVTFQGQDIPLQTAVDALLQAANLPSQNALYNADGAARAVTVNWKGTPFWEAAKDLETQTGLRWTMTLPRSVLTLRLGPPINPDSKVGLAGLDGARTPLSKVVAGQITYPLKGNLPQGNLPQGNQFHNDLLLGFPFQGNQPQDEGPYLPLTTYLDPHVRVVPGSVKVDLTTPLTTQNAPQSYAPFPPLFGSLLSGSVSNFRIKVDAHDQVGNHDHPTIPLIQGVLSAQAITKSETWEVPNITVTKTGTHAFNGSTYMLEDVTLDGDKLTLRISIRVPTTQPQVTTGMPVRLLDGEGKEVTTTVSTNSSVRSEGTESNTRESLVYSLRVASKEFPAGEVRPGPFKLTWDIPTEVHTLKVPFEFRDVPLP